MSSVYLHIGQCGVQIGQEFWNEVASRTPDEDDVKHTMWSSSADPLCLFIDSERKVIQKLANETKKLKTTPSLNVLRNSIRCRKGCGSNWAMGFHGLGNTILGKDLPRIKAGYGKYMVDENSNMLQICEEGIRVKVEACDSFSGFICMNSLGGGTGSGLGAKLCQELKDIYPAAYRLWNVVAPHSMGESPTQHYNQLLSLAKLQENSDAIVLFENDHILNCLSKPHTDSNVSMTDMNKLIADTMLSLYLPVSTLSPRTCGLSIGIEPWELMRSVAPMPSLKFLQTSHADSSLKETSADIWDKLLRKASSRARSTNQSNVNESCIAALCVCRGIEKSSYPDTIHISKKLKSALHCVSWNPYPIDVWLHEPKTSSKRRPSKSLTTCMNNSSVRKILQRIVKKSKLMLDSKAYLHWYLRYGTSENDFVEALETLLNITESYDEMNRS